MNLKKFKKENNKRGYIVKIASAFMVVGILLVGISYAVYQKVDEKTFINAKVGNFKENDIELALKLNGNDIDAPPAKDNYTVTVDCDNATGKWDTTAWGAMITNITSRRVKCEVNFATPKATLSTVTATPDKTTISLSYTAGGIGTSTTCVYGKTNSYGSSASSVTNSKCSITGLSMDTTYYYKVCAKNVTGEVCKEGNTKTKPNSDPISKVNVGDYISMTPTATSYSIPTSVTGYSTQTINPSELNLWRVIKKNSDGTVDMVSDKVSSVVVTFYGRDGYLNFVGGLNTIAAQYTDGKHVQSTRHMGYSNQTETCTALSTSKCPSDTGYKTDLELVNVAYGGSASCTSSCSGLKAYKAGTTTYGYYWLASRYFDGYSYGGRLVGTSGGLYGGYLVGSDGAGNDSNLAVRPIVTLKSTVEIESGSGTSSSPYKLV